MTYSTPALTHLLEKIGDQLYTTRHARKEKIMSVANGIGVSHAVISKIENGRYNCLSLELLAKIADYYKIPLVQILSMPTEPSANPNQETQNILISYLIEENKSLKKERANS